MAFPPRYKVEGYKKLNNLGRVPYFIDGETHMTESSAICHYLAEKSLLNKNSSVNLKLALQNGKKSDQSLMVLGGQSHVITQHSSSSDR